MSASGRKANLIIGGHRLPLMTLSGHSAPLTNVVFDDATEEAGEDRREGAQSKCGSISKIRPSDGCGGETIAATVKFAYDRHGFESYMGNVG